MRQELTKQLLNLFLDEFAKQCKSSGKIYLTGGATALLHDFRKQTIDIDLKLDPEPKGAFEAIAMLKNKLDINIELASPDQFIPSLPDWQSRSIFIKSMNNVEFYHFDPYSQVLAKIERGFANDKIDVESFINSGMVDIKKLNELYTQVKPMFLRYPSVNVSSLDSKISNLVKMNKI